MIESFINHYLLKTKNLYFKVEMIDFSPLNISFENVEYAGEGRHLDDILNDT